MLDQSACLLNFKERGDVHSVECVYKCIRAALVSSHCYTELCLFLLALFGAESGDEAVSFVRMCCLGSCCPAETVVKRYALAFVALAVAVSIIVRNLCPCVISGLLSCVECVDHPGALKHHAYDAGHEHEVRICLSHKVLCRHGREQVVCQPCHSFNCLGIIHTGCLIVIRDELAAETVDEVVPAVLAVICIHCCAIDAVSFACFADLGSSCCIVIPCPCVIRICNTIFVEDCLVVDHSDRVMILRKRELVSVKVVDVYDAFIVICKIDCVVSCDVVVEIEKHVCSHVLLCFIDVHPENVRKLAARSACLKKCPVLDP